MNWTAAQAAKEWGLDPKTMAKRIRAAGLDVAKGKKYSTAEITQAVVGDKQSEQIREIRARADLLELERRQKEGEVVDCAAMEKRIADVFAPLRSALLSAPAELAARCNPSDPDHARAALRDWVDRVLRTGREAAIETKEAA